MSGSRSARRRASAAAALGLLAGCPGSAGLLPGADCPDGSTPTRANADSCDDVFCGEATVEIGVTDGLHLAAMQGQEAPIGTAGQPGYHVSVSARVTGACPVVFLHQRGFVLHPDGEVLFSESRRHVQMVREDAERADQWVPDGRLFVPCEWWPDDPDSPFSCTGEAGTQSEFGHIEDQPIRIEVELEDHNDPPRTATAEVVVQPTCCS